MNISGGRETTEYKGEESTRLTIIRSDSWERFQFSRMNPESIIIIYAP